jgi:hypothetical protein
VTLEHGVPERLTAISRSARKMAGRLRHVEEMDLGHGVLGVAYDAVARRWFERAVEREVAEIA